MKNKLSTKQIVTGGAILAIMIISQLFKNLSVYITGPIVNACLIIATLTSGLVVAILLSVIAPITSYFISGAPIQVAFAPWLQIAIIFGNIILCLCVYFACKLIKKKFNLPIGLLAGSVLKALFMGALISNFILNVVKTALPDAALTIAKTTFSVTQLVTALMGSVLAYIIWLLAGKAFK